MFIRSLGEEITMLRKQQKMTQTELASNICSQPAISQIEKGEAVPALDTLYHIALKLNVPMDHFLQVLEHRRPEYVEETIRMIEDANTAHAYEDVYEITKKELKAGAIESSWMHAYLLMHQTITSYKTEKIEAEEAIQKLRALFEQTTELDIKKEGLDMRIYNAIGAIYGEQNEFDQAERYHTLAYEAYVPKEPANRSLSVFHLRVLYNKVMTLSRRANYEASLYWAEEGINRSLAIENITLLGQFYYYYAQSMERLGGYRFESIQQAYERALFIFKLLDKKVYIDLLLKQKAKYVGET
ncbi:helix-turn-helix domain-containing protein [Salsuginibacillus kocurii]|uniref:helix-turn-helix domain-containing protein n=1 Tax=Salsuginibacillus kocurii TaxID=427078 RepID=UPI00036755C0|nr:helix-turn-helix domain-containing protein [Salsuginibacillus kocurii]